VRGPDQRQLRTVVLQRLQSLESAGLLDLPRVRGSLPDAAAESLNAGVIGAVPEKKRADVLHGEEKLVLKNNPSQANEPGLHVTTSGNGYGCGSTPRLSRERRVTALAALRDSVATCSRCRELATTRTQTVFGVGNPMARLVFLGEAPGADEDRQGEPFVGRAGQLLTKIIEACTLKREDVYILNILKCRPPGNRNPSPEEAANCREYLQQQLEIIRPEFICCLGSVAAQNLLDTTTSIGQLRGAIHHWNGIKVVATYHPAYLLRNPSAKRATWDDMRMIMQEMGIILD